MKYLKSTFFFLSVFIISGLFNFVKRLFYSMEAHMCHKREKKDENLLLIINNIPMVSHNYEKRVKITTFFVLNVSFSVFDSTF